MNYYESLKKINEYFIIFSLIFQISIKQTFLYMSRKWFKMQYILNEINRYMENIGVAMYSCNYFNSNLAFNGILEHPPRVIHPSEDAAFRCYKLLKD